MGLIVSSNRDVGLAILANIRRETTNKAHVIGDIGGLDFGPNMAVISFVHPVQDLAFV